MFFTGQDQLSTDLYSFASKEGDYARYFLTVSSADRTALQMWVVCMCPLHGPLRRDEPGFIFGNQLLEAQADYHRRSLAALEAALPTIQLQQGEKNT